jgi:eukaryotic-like serine/threonine-protein kinase
MDVRVGSRLGPYEIIAPLGAGGFGVVYKATDTRLNRTVAIKVLSPSLSSDPQFRERFDREARTISRLDHPHICALYDVGEQDGTSFLVMQYLEGETLEDRLKKGALPLDQALQCAIEVADALDKAHRAGIVHRDLKPGNVMLTKGGAKLLDFGLAKAAGPGGSAAALSAVTMAGTTLTAQGTILGTLHYMAPEQLEGKEVDSRADVFGFGAVLFEMVTGRKAFEGQSQASIIAAIMNRDPPQISTLRPLTPPLVDHLVARCLAKDRDERWQTASDVMRELKWIAQATPQLVEAETAKTSSSTARSWRRATYGVGFVAVSLALILGYLIGHSPAAGHEVPNRRFPIRLSVAPPRNAGLSSVQLAFSPDGTSVAYIVLSGDRRQVWLYSLTGGESHALAGTDDAKFPFWSADGQHIGFVTDRGLTRISVAGGPPQDLAPASIMSSGAWSDEGILLFAGREQPGIYRIRATGGSAAAVTTLNASREELLHAHPRFLPGGKQFLYFVRSRKPEYTGVYVGSLDADNGKLLLHTQTHAEYVAPGYLVFVRQSMLMAQRFNIPRLELEGDPFPVVQAVNANTDNGASGFSVSRDGSLVYHATDPQDHLKWVDRQGTVTTSLGPPGFYRGVELSSDDRKVLVRIRGTDVGFNTDLWVIDPSRDIRSRVTVNARSQNARWSPDGQHVFFDSQRPFDSGVYRKRSDGSGPEELVWKTDGTLADVGKDGHLLVEEGPTCKIVEPLAQTKAATFIESPFISSCGRFARDGRFVAYTQNESGRAEVYVVPFPQGTPRLQVSKDGGRQPRWRKDGGELFYLSPDGALMSVTLTYAPNLHASAPRELFRAGVMGGGLLPQYSVTDDGQRFLMIDQVNDSQAEGLTVIAHWNETLKP